MKHVVLSLPIRVVLAAGILASQFALAASDTWNGSGPDTKWQTGANWVGGTPPQTGDQLFFTGTTGLANTNNFNNFTFNGITINSPAGAFTLWGNSIALAGGITNNQVVTPQTINLPLSLSITPTIDVVSNAILTLGGVISGSSGLTKMDGGILSLTAPNTFSGSVTVSGGILSVGADNNLGATPGSATTAALVLNGGTLRTTAGITINANRGIALGPTSGSGSGSIDVPGGSTTVYSGIMANNSAGVGGVTKLSFGGLTISGTNTYTGPTVIQNGTLTLNFTAAGSPPANIISTNSSLVLGGATGGIFRSNGATLFVSGKAGGSSSQTFSNTLIDTGSQIIVATNNGSGTVNVALKSLTHNTGGAVAFVTPALYNGGNLTTTATNVNGILGGWATISDGAISTGNGGNIMVSTNFACVDPSGNIVNFTNFAVPATTNVTLFDAGLLNANTNVLIGTNLSTAAFGVRAAPDTNTPTTYDVNAILFNSMPSGSTFIIGTNNTLRLGRFGGILKHDQPLGGPTLQFGYSTAFNVETLTAGGAPNTGGEIVLNADANNQNSGNFSINSAITDNGSGKVAFIKTGTGPANLNGNNTYSGGTYVLQGRLQLSGSTNLGAGPITVLPGAQIFFSVANLSLTNDFFVSGLGFVREGEGALRFGSTNCFMTGTVTLLGDSRIGSSSSSGSQFWGFTTVSGKITGAYGLEIGGVDSADGGIILANSANDWRGNTTIRNSSNATTVGGIPTWNYLRNGASEVIPNGFGFGNVFMDGSSTATAGRFSAWDLNGFNETINGLSTTNANPSLCIISNSTSTATLTVGDNDQSGTFLGNFAAGPGTLNVTKIGGGIETLGGTNTFNGTITVSNGVLALSGSGTISNVAAVRVNTGGAFDISGLTNGGFITTHSVNLAGGTMIGNTAIGGIAALNATNGALTVNLNPPTTNVYATTLTTGGSTNLINISLLQNVNSYPTQFVVLKYAGSIGGAGNNFGIGSVPSLTTQGYVTNDTSIPAVVVVLTNGPKPLTWTGTNSVNPTFWDVNTTTNWLAFGSTPAPFNNVDSVTFDDSGTTTTVNVITNVNPASITVTNPTKNYVLTGSGAIGGVGGLTKAGAGTLMMMENGGDGFRGGVAVNAGTVIMAADNTIAGGATIASGATLQVGTNGGSGNPPSGSIGMDGSLIINRRADLTISGVISGASTGSLTKNDTNVLTLSGNNTFTGAVAIVSGTLKTGSGSALGNIAGTTAIADGAMLDVNGNNLGAEPITVSGSGVGGAGAIVNNNNSVSITRAVRNVTMTNDTVFGGTARWDLRSSADGLTDAHLNGAFNITKVGTNQVSLVGAVVDSGLGNVTVKQGTLSLELGTAPLGNAANTLTVSNGATLQLFNLNSGTELDKQFVLNGDGVATTLTTGSGAQNKLGGNMTLNGNCIINAASGSTLTVTAPVSGTANVVQTGAGTNLFGGSLGYAGTTTISNGVLVVTGGKSSGTGITIATAGGLGGSSSLNGESVVANGRLIAGDPSNVTGTLDLGGGNLTLNGNTNLFTLKQGGGPLGSSRVVGINNFTVNGTSNNAVLLAFTGGSPLLVGDTFTLFSFSTTTATVSNFVVGPLQGYTFDITNTGTEIDLIVKTAVKSLVWDGSPSGVWDTNVTTADWIWPDSSFVHTNFSNGDFATFDGNGIVRTVNVSTVVAPAPGQQILFNDSNPYTLTGSGSITGSASVFLRNGLTVTIANSNAITGPTVIDFGTVQLGNGGSIGSLGTGAITATNAGNSGNQFLIFNRSDSALIVSNPISGFLSVTNIGTGMVSLAAANTFSGGVTVAGGTLRTLNNSALGSTNIPVVVSNNATLDITNGVGVQPIVVVSGFGVSSNGAIVNNSGTNTFVAGQGVTKVIMTGDTAFGGTGRLDFRSNPVDLASSTNFYLSTGGNAYNLTKVGSGQFQVASIAIDPALSNIDIKAGTFGVQTLTNLGDPNGTITVFSNATLTFFDQSNAISKVTVLRDGAILGSTSGSNLWNGNITMNGSNVFSVTAVSLNLFGTIGGSPTAIRKEGGNTLMLHGNALPAPSALWDLSAGTLDLTAASSSTLTLAGSQTLRGNGGVNGSVSLGASTTLSPGEPSTNSNSLGTLTASNSLTASGAVLLELNLTNSSTVSNDLVAASSITLNGTVTVSNIGPALVTGDSFKLFSVVPTGSYTLNPLPPLAGGLAWSNRLSIDGSILVISSGPTTNAPILSVRLDNGTNVVIHGTNNNTPNTSFHYSVLTSTNITLPLSNWTSIATNGFNGNGTYDFTNPIAPGKPVLFYDTKAVP